MNLTVDIGNSRTKIGVFEGDKLRHTETYEVFGASQVHRLYPSYPIHQSIVASVAQLPGPLVAELRSLGPCVEFTHETPLPVTNHYTTPETLGLDRLAAVVAARKLFPGQPVLAIDAGTAITYDLVDAEGHYKGGVISPGVNMRFKAMHEFTRRLPLLHADKQAAVEGHSTKTCMLSGGLHGTVFEMEGYIRWYQTKYKGLQAVLTGGDAAMFEKHLKSKIFAVPELVLQGLNEILHYNVST